MAASSEAAQAGAPALHDIRVEPPLSPAPSPPPSSAPRESQPDLDRRQQAASPIERMRTLYQKRRRPILLGLAAALVTLGTIQVTKLSLPNPGEMDLGARRDGEECAGGRLRTDGRQRVACSVDRPVSSPGPGQR